MNIKLPFPKNGTAEHDRLRARVTELEASCRTKDQFVSRLSHELRTPLTTILLWTSLLRAGEVGEHERDEALRTMEESAHELQKLAEDLIELVHPVRLTA